MCCLFYLLFVCVVPVCLRVLWCVVLFHSLFVLWFVLLFANFLFVLCLVGLPFVFFRFVVGCVCCLLRLLHVLLCVMC